jgi:type I restriction enzyme R subunit
MDEAQTRWEIIDRKLALADWDVCNPTQVIQELDIELEKAGYRAVSEPKSEYEGHRFADYGLLLRRKPCAVRRSCRARRRCDPRAPGQPR